MDPILEAIDIALKKKGLSDAAASKLAVGHPSFIKNMRMPREGEKRYNLPSLMKLAEVLELEFYFGEPRLCAAASAPISWGGLLPHRGFAKCGVDGWGRDQPDREALPKPEFINDPGAFYVSASGQSMQPEGIHGGDVCLISPAQQIREGDRIWIKDKSGATAIKRLVKMKGGSVSLRGWMPVSDGRQTSFDEERMNTYIDQVHPVVAVFRGKPGSRNVRFIPDPESPGAEHVLALDDADFALIGLHDVQAAAGVGRMNWEGGAISSLAFPRMWLRAKGIIPDAASLIFVDGDSMEPTLRAGSMVMINHNSTKIRGRRIYAFRQGDELRVKRLEMLDAGQLLVTSDNQDVKTELLCEDHDVQIIGEVVWSAHDL